jgi:hypothetical protein
MRVINVMNGGDWSNDTPSIPSWLALTIPSDYYERSSVLTTRIALREQALTLLHQRHHLADAFVNEV